MAISTSQAVKAVVNETMSRLELPWLFNGFYDINRDFDEQFHQYYAKVNDNIKLKPWAALMFSYDPASQFDRHHRPFGVKKRIDVDNTHLFRAGYFTTDLLFSVLSNDSNITDSLGEELHHCIDRDFTTSYPDIMWKPWLAEETVLSGTLRRPSAYNAKIYESQTAGTTGAAEPEWTAEVGDLIEDGEVTWKCIEPESMLVRAYDFKVVGFEQKEYMQNGILFKTEFGCTLMFAAIKDLDRVLPQVTYLAADIFSYSKDPSEAALIDKQTVELA